MIAGFKPDVVGIGIRNLDNASSCNTVFFLDGIKDEVIIPCKRAFSGPIVIGGAAVGISGAAMLDLLDLEYAIRGDGEETMSDFVKSLEGKLPQNDIGGLIRRVNGDITIHNSPHRMADLNNLSPVTLRRYVNLSQYRRFGTPLQMQTKRGCALECIYCTYNQIGSYRLRKPELVADEIEKLVVETGIRFVEFTDSTFNIPLPHAKEVLRALRRKKLRVKYRTMGLNPSAVDEELVDLMKEVGFQEADLGVESCCDATLKTLGKGFGKQDIVRAVRLLRQANIPTSCFLLVGAPGETEETLNETFDGIAQAVSTWDLVIIGVGIRIYKGAPIAGHMRLSDRARTEDEFLRPVYYQPDSLDLERIKRITKDAYHRHPNFLIYNEKSQYPAVVISVLHMLLRCFAPRQPIWRIYILARKVLMVFGVD